jgi:hypothetical protein
MAIGLVHHLETGVPFSENVDHNDVDGYRSLQGTFVVIAIAFFNQPPLSTETFLDLPKIGGFWQCETARGTQTAMT